VKTVSARSGSIARGDKLAPGAHVVGGLGVARFDQSEQSAHAQADGVVGERCIDAEDHLGVEAAEARQEQP
jgi:hypothetical protein